MNPRTGRTGFTLIETILVLIVLGVVVAVIASRFDGTSVLSVTAQAETLKAHLRYAQTRAMNSNSIWGIRFIDGTHYALFRDGTTANTVLLPGETADPVDLGAEGLTLTNLGTQIVSFDDWGKPYTDAAATNLQTAARSITVTNGTKAVTISITRNTGYIP